MSALESRERRGKIEELTRVRRSARPKVRAKRERATNDANNTSTQEVVKE